MLRRNITIALVAVLALQLLGSVAFASVCPEPCPDDTETSSCPPVCAICTTCTHAQTGIVQHTVTATPLTEARRFTAAHLIAPSSQLEDDIFHVPLIG